MKLLLTGATGYIGSALLKRLRAQGDEVVTIGRLAEGEILSERFASVGQKFDGFDCLVRNKMASRNTSPRREVF